MIEVISEVLHLGLVYTYSRHNSTSRRRGTSSEVLLNRLQAYLQRDRAATMSGVNAQKSSPRSIFSLSESAIITSITIIVIYY